MFVMPAAASLHRRALHRPWPGHAARACGFVVGDEGAERVPRLDVLESDDAYTVVLDLPGVSKEQLQVTVEGQKVDVSTLPAADAGTGEAKTRVLHRERDIATYRRSVVLPAEVDNAQSQARFENGVLTLKLAKRTPAGAIRIQVN